MQPTDDNFPPEQVEQAWAFWGRLWDLYREILVWVAQATDRKLDIPAWDKLDDDAQTAFTLLTERYDVFDLYGMIMAESIELSKKYKARSN